MAGDSAVLYLAEVTRETACIQFQCEKKFEVENRQPLAVTIYDYYMPSELAFEGREELRRWGWLFVFAPLRRNFLRCFFLCVRSFI